MHRLHSPGAVGTVLVRDDSAFYGRPTIGPAVRAGADVSVIVRLTPPIKTAIAGIEVDAWTPIEYTDAVYDEQSQAWVSRAEVAEVGFTAFASAPTKDQVPGRLVVRRIPDLNPASQDGRDTLFDTWRFHAFFTTTDSDVVDTVTADKTHRGRGSRQPSYARLDSGDSPRCNRPPSGGTQVPHSGQRQVGEAD